MDCEMCGREQAVAKVSVEGAVMALCTSCGKYGTVVSRLVTEQPHTKQTTGSSQAIKETKPAAPEETEFVVANIGSLLKQKREELGRQQEEGVMKLEDFARHISVKESVLHKMETGAFLPGVEEAKRIGKKLGLKLVERVEDVESIIPPAKKDELTLGDLIKIKKKK